MRKGQVTADYLILLGLVAATLVVMLVYFGRAFQGNVRSQAEQLGAGQYDPGKTRVNNSWTKKVVSTEKITGSENATVTIEKKTDENIGKL
jgi:hypothetical protein